MQVQLTRNGCVAGRPVRITKGLTLEAGGQTLEIAYLLEGLPPGEPVHFGVEFNFAGLPAGCDDRYFHDARRNSLGQLGTRLDLQIGRLSWPHRRMARASTSSCAATSRCTCGRSRSKPSANRKPASSWCTNRSSSTRIGCIEAGSDGRWATTMTLAIDTSMAEKRRPFAEAIATVA